jgi:hypothetical protein
MTSEPHCEFVELAVLRAFCSTRKKNEERNWFCERENDSICEINELLMGDTHTSMLVMTRASPGSRLTKRCVFLLLARVVQVMLLCVAVDECGRTKTCLIMSADNYS